MQLLLEHHRAQLIANGIRSQAEDIDPYPVVKLFTPDAGATWLLTEIDPNDPDLAFDRWGFATPRWARVAL